MKIYEPIVVDLYKLYPLKMLEVPQGNIGRGAIVTLTAGESIVNPIDEDVKLWAKRPKGNISYISCSVQDDGRISVPFTSQMLSEVGEVIVSLEMINGEEDITTPIFKIGVTKNISNHEAAESQNEFTALKTAITEMNAAMMELKEIRKQDLSKIRFMAYNDFPSVGEKEILYVDTSAKDDLLVYYWDGSKYACHQEKQIEVVDPATAKEEGKAADAKLTGAALSELNSNSEKNVENLKSLIDGKLQYYVVSVKNIDQIEGFPSAYCIGMGALDDGTAVVSFHLSWIDIQIRVDANNIYMRFHYGSNGWNGWKQIANFQ